MHEEQLKQVRRKFALPEKVGQNSPKSLKICHHAKFHGDRWNHPGVTRNLNGHIDLHIHAGSASDNRVTLTFDLLTSFS